MMPIRALGAISTAKTVLGRQSTNSASATLTSTLTITNAFISAVP